MKHEIEISVPAIIEITRYKPGRAAMISGPPEDCYEAEAPDVDFRVLDMNGNEIDLPGIDNDELFWIAVGLVEDEG